MSRKPPYPLSREDLHPGVLAVNARKVFKARIVKHYATKESFSPYQYEVLLDEYPNARAAGAGFPCTPRIERSITKKLKDAILLRDRWLFEYRATQDPSMHILRLNQDRRNQAFTGMLGKTHTPESKAKISAAMRLRHAEGRFKAAALGRPSKEVALAKLKEEAQAFGLSPLGLLKHREKAASHLDKLREEVQKTDAQKKAEAAYAKVLKEEREKYDKFHAKKVDWAALKKKYPSKD